MPQVIAEALEPDVVGTFLLLVLASVVVGWPLSRRSSDPWWLVTLALLSVAAIVATTVVPQGGWGFLWHGYSQPLAECLGLDAWRDLASRPIEADTLLNVVLYIPAGFLWVVLDRRPLRVVLVLALLSVAIESWQAISHGRSCTANDVAANTVGAVVGASVGVLIGRLVARGSPGDDGTAD